MFFSASKMDLRVLACVLLATSCGAMSACNDPGQPGQNLVSDPVDGTSNSGQGQTGDGNGSGGSGTPGGSSSGIIGSSCVTSDSSHICIGVKFISYTQNGTPAMTQDQAVTLIDGINKIWATCNVGFQIEEYDQVDPTSYGLTYGASSENELTQIRQQFSNNSTFLVAITGDWNTSTIAWTEMPGGGPYGAIIDATYGTHAVAVGHELGHYQGLDHVQTSGNLMYPVVYDTDTTISSDQCATAVSTDQSYWTAMLRQ